MRVSALIRDSGYRGLVLDRLLRHVVTVTGASESCLLVRSPGNPADAIVAATVGMDEGVVGAVVQNLDLNAPAMYRAAAFAGVPPQGGDRGRLEVALSDPARERQRLIDTCAAVLASALEHARVPSALAARIHDEVEILARDAGDWALPGGVHADIAREVAIEMGLAPADALEAELAALLYEAGTIFLDSEDPADAAVAAADILAAVPGLEAVATIVRYHGERFGGGGGPEGLVGSRIPVASRILAVCRRFRDLAGPSSRQGPFDVDGALEYIAAAAPAQYDPAVVVALALVVHRPGGADPGGTSAVRTRRKGSGAPPRTQPH